MEKQNREIKNVPEIQPNSQSQQNIRHQINCTEENMEINQMGKQAEHSQEKTAVEQKITVVIPNYNGIKFIEECLLSLFCQEAGTPEYRVIMVDNGSEDGSRERVEERFPQVSVIALPQNTGFCHAVNVGIRAAGTPYVILLNNDTKVAPRFVTSLYNAIEQKKNAFSVSAKMLMWAGTAAPGASSNFTGPTAPADSLVGSSKCRISLRTTFPIWHRPGLWFAPASLPLWNCSTTAFLWFCQN